MLNMLNTKERGDKMQRKEKEQLFVVEEKELMDICGGDIGKNSWETADTLLQWLGKLFGYKSNE